MNDKTSRKYYLFPLLIQLFISNISYAQRGLEDVVYLKNGWIIRGTILEFIPDQSIKIQTTDRCVFVFKSEEIVKTTKEKSTVAKTDSLIKESRFIKKRFVTMAEINYNVGNGSVEFRLEPIANSGTNSWSYRFPNQSHVGVKIINGIQFKGRLFLGTGIGVNLNKPNGYFSDGMYFPVTFEARFTILKKSICPTINSSIGYLFGEEERHKGGLIFNPSVGLKTYIYQNVALFFNLGYKIEYHTLKEYYGNYGPNYPNHFISQGYLKFYTGCIGVSF